MTLSELLSDRRKLMGAREGTPPDPAKVAEIDRRIGATLRARAGGSVVIVDKMYGRGQVALVACDGFDGFWPMDIVDPLTTEVPE